MDMSLRIEKRESFRVVGYSMHTTNKGGKGRKAIPTFWDELSR